MMGFLIITNSDLDLRTSFGNDRPTTYFALFMVSMHSYLSIEQAYSLNFFKDFFSTLLAHPCSLIFFQKKYYSKVFC